MLRYASVVLGVKLVVMLPDDAHFEVHEGTSQQSDKRDVT